MNTQAPLLYWFRQDLRLQDNAGLTAAAKTGQRVIGVYIDDPSPELRPLGGASRWWLHHSLQSLQKEIPLVIRRGEALTVLRELIRESGAAGVMWGRCYEPESIARDTRIKDALTDDGLIAESHNTHLLFEPWQIKTKAAGGPYQVFTPFWRNCLAAEPPALPLPKPQILQTHSDLPSLTIDDLNLLPRTPDWASGLRDNWQPGEDGAQKNLATFIKNGLNGYKQNRDNPALSATSRLSPHLHWGEISVRQIWHEVHKAVFEGRVRDEMDSDHFLSEIGWREFSHHLLYHFPHLPQQPLIEKFSAFPWESNEADLKAWQKGQTGYPIIDAGMRQLWQTGWMHNRVRMIVGSFLVKNLLISWQEGEAWFWDTLVDADLANNVASWQWIAGCGADAAPFFRIFNPVLQGEKFDPQGDYVRRYIPELKDVPTKFVHKPWEAPTPPQGYPAPIIGLKFSRDRALAALSQISAASSEW